MQKNPKIRYPLQSAQGFWKNLFNENGDNHLQRSFFLPLLQLQFFDIVK